MKRVFNQSIGWLTAPAGVVSAIGFGKDASYLDAVMQDTPPSHVSSGIVEQLAREAVAVARLLSFSQMLYLVLVVVAAFAAARLVRGTVHGARRLGLDGARKLATVHSVANVLIVGAAAYAVLVRFLSAAPVITLAALVLGVGSSLLVFAAPLQSVWVGVGLALRRRVREGD
ncbi:MAG: hypothetical protein MUF54_02550, partial [Polyangiaceae bacterium]|nr:hypothetical protein [Polyangiaceae bacterium]